MSEQESLIQSGEWLPIMEEFYSLQGEGYNTGKAAYFIRIGGCDVGCHFCDVKESWNASLHNPTPIMDVVERARECPAQSVIITGGEPLLYNLTPLCEELGRLGIERILETSGSSPMSGSWDWICLSAKRNIPPTQESLSLAHELKMIICDKEDFEFAEYYSTKVGKSTKLFLQPEWSVSREIMQDIVDYIKLNPKWRISLQSHKYMRIP